MPMFQVIFTLLSIFIIMGYSWVYYKYSQYLQDRNNWTTIFDETSEIIVKGFNIINYCNWIGTISLVCVLYCVLVKQNKLLPQDEKKKIMMIIVGSLVVCFVCQLVSTKVINYRLFNLYPKEMYREDPIPKIGKNDFFEK